jgi:hypothetical protein
MHAYTPISTYINTYTHKCIQYSTYIHTLTYIIHTVQYSTYIHTYITYIHSHTYIHNITYIHTRARARMYTYIHTYIHARAETQSCISTASHYLQPADYLNKIGSVSQCVDEEVNEGAKMKVKLKKSRAAGKCGQ